jgi:hypothetical protein
MVLHSKLPRPQQLTSGKPDAQGSSVLADHPMREWTLKPIACKEQSRPLLPTVRRSPARGSSLAPLPGVATDAVGLQRQAYR